MTNFSLKTTDQHNASAQPARSFGHDIEQLISQLKIPATALPRCPSPVKLKNGSVIQVRIFHEAWRYGEKIASPDAAIQWLQTVIKYAEQRL